MKKNGMRILALVLCAVMVLGMLPVFGLTAKADQLAAAETVSHEGLAYFEDNFDGYTGETLEAGEYYTFGAEAPALKSVDGRGNVLDITLDGGGSFAGYTVDVKAEELNRILSFDVKFDADSLGSWGGIYAKPTYEKAGGAENQLYAVLSNSDSDSVKPGITLKSGVEEGFNGFAQHNDTFDPEVWYSVKLANVGNAMAAKVWPADESEPAEWTVAAYSEFTPDNANADVRLEFVVTESNTASFLVDNLCIQYLEAQESEVTEAPAEEEAEEEEEEEIRYEVKAVSADETMGTVSGGGKTYLAGVTIKLCAFPKYGYTFAGWTNPEGEVVSMATGWLLVVDRDYDLTANFVKNSENILSFMAEGLTQMAEIDAENRTVDLRFASDVDLTNVYPYFYLETGAVSDTENYTSMDLSEPVTIGVGEATWTVTAVQNEVMQEFYVDPVRGDDENAGTSARKAFRTLAAAQEAVRAIEEWTGDVVVHLSKGEYTLDETMKFGLEDSAEKGYAVIWEGTEDANEVVINSAQYLEGEWTESADVPNLADGLVAWEYDAAGVEYGRDLFVDGELAQLAGFVTDESEVGSWAYLDLDYVEMTDTGYEVSGELADMYSWHNPTDIEFMFEVGWTCVIIPVVGIEQNANGSTVTLKNDAYNAARTKGGMQIADPTSIINCFEGLDTAGEWYFDRAAEKIYYITDGADPNGMEVVMPTLEQLVTVDGEVSEDHSAEFVYGMTFKNITFRYTSYLQPHTYGQVEIQASFCVDLEGKYNYKKTYGAFVANYVEGLRITGCIFTDLAASAVDLEYGCKGCQFVGNSIIDVGANGLCVGSVEGRQSQPYSDVWPIGDELVEVGAIPDSVTEYNLVMSNHLNGIGLRYKGAVAILLGYVADTTASHNTITNASYTGISAGWGWGNFDGNDESRNDTNRYRFPGSPSVQARYVIEHNSISGVCQRLADGGGVYTLSLMPGSKLNRNLFFDNPVIFGGIYLDEGAGGFTEMDRNIIYNVYTNFNYHTVAGFSEREKAMLELFRAGENYVNVEPDSKKADEEYAEIYALAGYLTEESGMMPPEIHDVDFTELKPYGMAWYVWVIISAAVLAAAAVVFVVLKKKKPAQEE